MDLLTAPADPALPTDPCPYVCPERWKGGPFLTYAQEKGKGMVVPPDLRRLPGTERLPCLELIDPTPGEELQALYQTWLLFRLAG
jgi:hypothetical protein